MPHDTMSCLAVTGADRESFLQGQLTQDVGRLAQEPWITAAWCNAKGCVVALLTLVPDEERILLFLPAWQAEDLRARLKRYRLRARVDIEPEAAVSVYAVAGTPRPQAAALAVQTLAGGRAPVSLVYATKQPVAAGMDVLDPAAWELAEIRAGRPAITASTTEQFTPHMLNLDLLDAISFRKGCYMGQEVVARTQHLGRPSRRMLAFELAADESPSAGERIVDADGAAAGTVLRAARSETGVELLAVTSLRSLSGELRLGAGAPVRPLRLPYSLPELESGP